MSVIDWLRKLGILRFGTYKGTYTSAKDMPDELFMDNVYDSKKDLITKEDVKKALGKKESSAKSDSRIISDTKGAVKMFCQHCGNEVAAEARFCSKCGGSISGNIEPAPNVEPAEQGTRIKAKKKMSLWKKIFIGIVVAIILIVTLALWATNDLLVPINNQLAALRNNDINTAYQETSTAFQQATSLKTFEQFVKIYPGLANNKEADFSERSYENNLGYVKGSLIAQDGGVMPIEYQLVKENDKWKILAINIPKAGQ